MATAYAALVSLFNNLELILNHPLHSFSFENEQIQPLRESVCFLIDFMETCDYHVGSKEAAEFLEWRIASAAQAADLAVESHVVDQIHAGSTLDGKRKRRPRFLLDLHKAIQGMDFVRRKAMKVQNARSEFKAEQPTYSASTPLTSVKNSNSMVGFDGVLLQLLDLLTGEATGRRVIPIVGMGGIGKTTLAANAFKNKYIVQHFDLRRWVTISQQYSVKEILSQLVYGQRKSTSETLTELGGQLHRELWGRRYLIVLDDIWSVEAWEKIRLFLPDDGNNSRIVVTTRLWNVADCFGPSSFHLAMELLDKDTSWNLFCEKAFGKQGCPPPELEDIGKKIVEKCKGLPLAIVVVGGHLGKSSRMQEYWENVSSNMNSVLDSRENDEQCLDDVLSLSYSHLPIHLKPCFLYMGTFMEDERVYASDLIKLWISEGFLKWSEAGRSLEEVAEDYLKDLIDRSLISFNTYDTRTCEIHDILRELCLKIAKKEKFFHVLDTARADDIHKESRVVISEKVPVPEIFDAPRPSLIRSLKYKGRQKSFFELRLLRVVRNKVDSEFTNEVDGGFLVANFQQVNLRYVHCSDGDIYSDSCRCTLYLPSSISLLWNLQTLIIKGVYIHAPYEIWEMPQLRHFESNLIFLPDHLCSHGFKQPDADELAIQALLTVANLKLSEEVCKRIPHIKKLRVVYYYDFRRDCDVEVRSIYCPHNLGRLQKLESLDCIFSNIPEWHDFALSLTFPNSLKELSLTIFYLDWEELTKMIGSLPLLEVVSLCMVKAGQVWNPVEGGFPSLKSLSISGCDGLIYWSAESFHFRVLENLSLTNLSALDEFPSGIGEIPTLKLISLNNCSISSVISAMRMLVDQERSGNDGFHLAVVYIDYDKLKLESLYKKIEEEDLRSHNLQLLDLRRVTQDEKGEAEVHGRSTTFTVPPRSSVIIQLRRKVPDPSSYSNREC